MNLKPSRHASLIAAAGLFAIISAPVLVPPQLPLIGMDQALAAGNGNGNNKEKSNNGNRGGGNSNRPSNSNSSNNGNGNGGNAEFGGNGNSGGGNLHAQLGGLNSLNRNVNGLMNSSDPRMVEIRQFVQAGADLVDAQAALVTAQTNYDAAAATYSTLVNSLGVGGYADTSPTGLQGELDAVNAALVGDPTNPDLLAAQTTLQDALTTINGGTEWTDLTNAAGILQTAGETVTTLEGATSDETLLAALQSAANPNRTVGQEEFDWAKMQLEETLADYLAAE